jgi:glycosyltransferase involved in cell wall biosynthesis
MNLKNLKIALVFDWMTTRGGAERVNLHLAGIFPNADIFTSVINHKKFPELKDRNIKTSFIQKLPFAKKKHQLFLSLMPYAYENFDLSEYDLVISSSHSCAKGIITKPETLHICYCHAPMRYAWNNWHQYINEYKLPGFIKRIGKKMIHKIRMWDKISADRPDFYFANSKCTQNRIQKYYRKESKILPPSIDVHSFQIANGYLDYFLAVGRLTPYKKFDLLVETFNKNKLPLKIVGTGIQEEELKKKAKSNIEFLGYVSEKELRKLYRECKALVFPQLEDFGITPLEVMASGRPVIAFKAGGALETVVDKVTGGFFEEQNEKSLNEVINKFQNIKVDPLKIRKHAEKFDHKHFKEELLKEIRRLFKLRQK